MKSFTAWCLSSLCLKVLAFAVLFFSAANAQAVTFNSNTNIGVSDAGFDGQDIIVSACTLTVDGAHTFASLLLTDGATLTHTPAYAGEPNNQVNLIIAGDCAISSDSVVVGDFLGYAPGAGPGAGYGGSSTYGCGGGHGGWGGINSYGNAGGAGYDSVAAPVEPGSGGGAGYSGAQGGYGGGVIRLNVGGTLQLDGEIFCRGGDNHGAFGGGGAGGSVNLTAGIFSGSGGISAGGGHAGLGYRGGGGAGGRVAVHCGAKTFSGTIAVSGGYGDYYAGGPLDLGGSLLVGGAGTMYLKVGSQPVGELTVDSGARFGNFTPLVPVDEAFHVLVLNRASLIATGAVTLTSLHLTANTDFTYANAITTNLALSVTSNLTVDAGAVISADAAGYAPDSGPGAGATDPSASGGGGGYGGVGSYSYHGYAGGNSYGSIAEPVDPGSGGGSASGASGGSGGGVIRLVVGGTLQLDGAITAKGGHGGGNYNSGGGSGGGIWVTTGTISGSGTISADGGTGSVSGGSGAGGRIAVYCGSDSFTGSMTAYGAVHAQYVTDGGAGTIWRENLATQFVALTVDNGGRLGTTPLTNAMLPPSELVDFRILNYATVIADSPLNFLGLVMINHATLLSGDRLAGLKLILTGNAQIDSTSALNMDGGGYAPDSGPGAGATDPSASGGGGGHGGNGSYSYHGYAGGISYGSIAEPVEPGSGGGSASGAAGGSGGGVIRLVIGGTLQLDGAITAKGGHGGGNYNSGGGSGGGIWVTTGTISGSGAISADGGTGSVSGGSGAGGRIAVYCGSDSFNGSITAYGAFHAQYVTDGGAGTVWRKNLATQFVALTVDNGGRPGTTTLTNSMLPPGELVDFRILNYATVIADSPLNFFGLMMINHATLLSGDRLAGLKLILTGNAQIDSTSALNMDGGGYAPDSGPGVGGGSYGGGGGHAGAGGYGWNGGTPGGEKNGDVTTPGSGGGNGFFGAAGYGGGVIHMEVAGNLDLEGALTANGNNGGAGGGAGGGIFLRAGSFHGHGGVSANGANGGPYAGGGGGGFLDVGISDTNYFEGALTANGGLRGYYTAADGDPGQVVFQANGVPTNCFLGQYPSGVLTRPVSSMTFALSGGPHVPAASDFELVTPSGTLSGNQLTLTNDGNFLTISFPAQVTAGDYALRLPANPRTPGTNSYVAANFSIRWPQISGSVIFTNGWPLKGIHVGTGLTGPDGSYSFLAQPGSSGAFAPDIYATSTPAQRSYANIGADIGGQNFSISGTLIPTLAISQTQPGGTLPLTWDTIPGLRYQLQSSVDLLNWQNCGDAQDASTNTLSYNFSLTHAPKQFFRVGVSSH